MRALHFGRADLNLLGPLIALLECRHVSRAAREVGLSQPAMSRALTRLRRLFDDELLVRTPQGYQLTRRAERLREQLAILVPQLETLLAGDDFEPASAAETFELVGSDYAVGVLGPGLCARVFADSPGSAVNFHGWHEGSFDELREGTRDLVFYGGEAPGDLRSAPLFDERFVCVVVGDHELAGRGSLQLDEYLDHDHLVIEVAGGGQPAVDSALSPLGRPRRSKLHLPFHALAPSVLIGTTLIATLPERLVRPFVDDRFSVLAAPKEIASMSYIACWHPLTDNDPAQRWLREVATAVAAA